MKNSKMKNTHTQESYVLAKDSIYCNILKRYFDLMYEVWTMFIEHRIIIIHYTVESVRDSTYNTYSIYRKCAINVWCLMWQRIQRPSIEKTLKSKSNKNTQLCTGISNK